MTTETRVIELICQHLGIEASTVTLDSHIMDDLGADSLDVIEIIMLLEEEYDIDIPESRIEEFETIAGITTYITDNIN